MPLAQIIQRKALFITGKGGIGKTLISAAIAQYAAAHGKKVCLIENTSHDQLAPLFGLAAVGHRVTVFDQNIYGINLEAASNFRDFVVKHLGYESLFDKIFNRAITRSFTSVLPGLAELTLLGRIYYAAELSPENFDLVIFDGYSSGHFHNLITTPGAIMQSGLIGPVIKETQRIIDFYQAEDNAGILLVANPEPLVISECVDFLPRLQAAGMMPVAAVLVNRYLDDTGVEQNLADLMAADSPLAAACEFIERRRGNYRQAVQGLRDDVAKLAPQLPLIVLKELGAVDEPLRATFGVRWLQDGVVYGAV